MMVDVGNPLMKSRKAGRGTGSKNTNVWLSLGHMSSWCLEYPGGLGELEAKIATLKRSQKKGI